MAIIRKIREFLGIEAGMLKKKYSMFRLWNSE